MYETDTSLILKIMILTLKIINKILVSGVFAIALFPFFASAQESLSLSVSPTLFEMTANPDQKWDSGVRIINSNPYEIVVYADVVNFAPQGEGGQGMFIPVDPSDTEGQTLAEWINLKEREIIIPAEQTANIPFSISVPEDAPPGGHYAAMLVGTKPPANTEGSSFLQTAQVVTSLIFLRVTGDVIEDGAIREFRSVKTLVEKPEMSFELRFENKGNVHILPQGEIKILNMWGQERGIIPVNRQMLFGNVLPEQIRKYSFSWAGEWSFSDMGRYTAVATLGYGYDNKQFVTSETFFWVLPWKIASTIALLLIGFIYLITWAIRIYIEKMFTLAGVSSSQYNNHKLVNTKSQTLSVAAPIEAGILDLRTKLKSSTNAGQKLTVLFEFVRKNKIFFFVVVLVIAFIMSSVWYVKNASVTERGYEVVVNSDNPDVKLSSEQVYYEELRNEMTANKEVSETKDFAVIKLINRSGVNGLAAEMRLHLESEGYEISNISSNFGESERNTVIVYHPDYAEDALTLSSEIKNVLLSSYVDAPASEPITVYVGSDYQSDVE
jgi:hypothetical protein